MRLQAVVAGLAVAMLGAGCALLAPTAERYAAPPVGTTYARDLRNTGSYGKSMREETRYAGARTWQGRTLLAHERSTGQTSMIDDGGGWVGQFKGDSPIFTFEPSLTVGFPLSVGKTTTKDIRMTVHAQNRVVPFKATWKVEAYEDVTVQAGTFKTFRILYEDELGVRSMSWVDPDTGILIRWKNERSAKHPLGAGTQDAELVSLKLANN
jgi:hypothetical protein